MLNIRAFWFIGGVSGAWLGIGLGCWQLLQHNLIGATAGLLLSIVCVAALLTWDRRFIRDGWWSALSGSALLISTYAALGSHL